MGSYLMAIYKGSNMLRTSYLFMALFAWSLVMSGPLRASASDVPEAAIASLVTEILFNRSDEEAIEAAVARELAAGNSDITALALADAARYLVAQNPSEAASMIDEALAVSAGTSPQIQQLVGREAAFVAVRAMEGRPELAAKIQNLVGASHLRAVQQGFASSPLARDVAKVQTSGQHGG